MKTKLQITFSVIGLTTAVLPFSHALAGGDLRGGDFACTASGRLEDKTIARATVYAYRPGCEAIVPWCMYNQVRAELAYQREDESVTRRVWLGYEMTSVEQNESGHQISIRFNSDPKAKAAESPVLLETLVTYAEYAAPGVRETSYGIQVPGFTPDESWRCQYTGFLLLPSAVLDPAPARSFARASYVELAAKLASFSDRSLVQQLLWDLGEFQELSTPAGDANDEALWLGSLMNQLQRVDWDESPGAANSSLRWLIRARLSTGSLMRVLDLMDALGHSDQIVRELDPTSQLIGRYCARARMLNARIGCEVPR